MRLTGQAPPGTPGSTLCPDDARVLDSVIEALSHQPSLRLTSQPLDTNDHDGNHPAKQRCEKLACVLGLLDRCPDEPAPADLVQRTIAKARSAQQRQRFTQQINALSGGTPGFRWSDMLTTAAMVMIGISLLWPALAKTRDEARRAACANNLAATGAAIGQYASDFGNALPRTNAKPGSIWWNVGQQAENSDDSVQSNSAHLYLLIRQHYISPNKLDCPDNPHANTHTAHAHDWDSAPAVSYSYQNQYTEQRQTLDRMDDMAILADKNPLFTTAANNQKGLTYRGDMAPQSSTTFHASRGQNVLTSSGRVMWAKRPVMPNGDNIWTIRGVDQYHGVEAPEDMNDSFLVP